MTSRELEISIKAIVNRMARQSHTLVLADGSALELAMDDFSMV